MSISTTKTSESFVENGNSGKEAVLLEKLKSRLGDLRNQDWKLTRDVYLLQWLKARKMNLDSTEIAIRQSMKWRKENHIEDLLNEEYTLEAREFFYDTRYTGTCHDGSPFFTMPAGEWDVRGFVDLYGKDEFVRFMTKIYLHGEQELIEFSEQSNKDRKLSGKTKDAPGLISRGLIGVVSGTGYSLKQLRSLQTIKAAMECARVYDTYFPQHVDLVYLINVSRIFMVVMKMMIPFLRSQICILGTDQETWKPLLLKRISAEQLPENYGGTRVVPK